MPAAPPPPKAPPPATAAKPLTNEKPSPPSSEPVSGKGFSLGPAEVARGERIVIYGPGGVGKTSAANSAPRPAFYDLDRSGRHFNLNVVKDVENWTDMRTSLQTESLWAETDTVIVDSATVAQEWALAHNLKTIPHEKGGFVDSIEGWGYGKGYRYLYDTFMCLLSDLEAHSAKGRHVVLVCHSTKELVTNPEGEDFWRYEPDLQNPKKDGRIRDRVQGWADHVFFVNHDTIADKSGKARATDTRSIRCLEMPFYLAKSRTLSGCDVIPYPKGSGELWTKLLGDSNVNAV